MPEVFKALGIGLLRSGQAPYEEDQKRQCTCYAPHTPPCKQSRALTKIEDCLVEFDNFIKLFFFHWAKHDASVAFD